MTTWMMKPPTTDCVPLAVACVFLLLWCPLLPADQLGRLLGAVLGESVV